MVGLKLFDREPRGFDRGRRDGLEKGGCDGLLNHRSADIETVHAASGDEVFASAVIPRNRVSTAIVNMQTPAAVTASGNACNSADPSLTAPPA